MACSASATAGTIAEGTLPAPSDFPKTSPGFLLPGGTTQVNGMLGPFNEGSGSDLTDWFEFQMLTPGASFSLEGRNTTHSEGGLRFSVFNSSSTQIGVTSKLEHNGNLSRDQVTGTVPSDGFLRVDAFQTGPVHIEGVTEGTSGSVLSGYQINLSTTTGVPEPSTLVGVGLGMGAMLAWRRRRAK